MLAAPAHATVGQWAGEIIGGLIGWIIGALGIILVLVMKALVAVAQYSDFIHSPAVSNGWKIVRDVCNMFFVLILLIIAFATILKIENYSYKKWLPKLILMAILINFSKTICGLLIDFAQVIMLTFVNAFKDIAAGNLITNLGITEILTLAKSNESIGFWEIVGSYVLGLLYIIVALVVIVTMLAMLVMRIVMIWIYVVLSPAAYLMSAFPGGQKYASQWWTEFSKNLIVGPVLAFFIWLSFVSLQTQNINQDFPTTGDANSVASEGGISGDAGANASSASQASSPSVFIKFIIAIGMLIGGLKISQEIGGAAGGMAGKGMAKLSKGAAFAGGLATGALAFGGKKAVGGLKAGGMMIANSDTSKKMLGKVAASSSGWAKYTGARALATGGLITVNKHQKEIEEKAQKKIEGLKNAQVVARYAREGAITPMGKALQKKAVNMMPSALEDPAKITDKLAGMSREELGKISDAEWHAIGNTGAQLQGRARTYIEKNSDERGAFNLGITDYNANIVQDAIAGGAAPAVAATDPRLLNMMEGTDRNGAPLTTADKYGSYMNPNKLPLHSDEQDRLRREGKYSTFYFKETPALTPNATTKVDSSQASAPRGNGNLSVNEFAREKSDTVAVDFDKLNIKGIDKGTDSDHRNVRGVNTSDVGLIKEISAKMVSMIDQELSRIKGKGANITVGDQKRMENLETAKNRFSNPGAIDNLSLVNSSAASYKIGDVKKSKIHEEVHGLGVEDEDDTRYVTQKVLDNHQYGAIGADAGRTNKETVKKILSEKPKNPSEATSTHRPVKDVLSDEAKTDTAGADLKIDTKTLDKSLEGFTKKLEDLSKKFGGAKPKAGTSTPGSASQPNFAYLFGSLQKSLNRQNTGLTKKISGLGGAKASTPLEVDVISNQVAGDLNNK